MGKSKSKPAPFPAPGFDVAALKSVAYVLDGKRAAKLSRALMFAQVFGEIGELAELRPLLDWCAANAPGDRFRLIAAFEREIASQSTEGGVKVNVQKPNGWPEVST